MLTAYYSDPNMEYASSASPALDVNVLNAAEVLFRNGLEGDMAACPIE
ncbi:MAG: hypothetical protein ABIR10_11680 [Dokdonella sp.]